MNILNLQAWMNFPQSSLVLFLILIAISLLIHHYFLRQLLPEIASGYILMALSIFAFVILPEMHPPHLLLLMIALEVFIIWFFFVIGIMQAYLLDVLSFNLKDQIDTGSWVTATAILALLMNIAGRLLHGFIILLVLTTLITYLIYVVLFLKALYINATKNEVLKETNVMKQDEREKDTLPVSGFLLLPVIATQAVVWLLDELFHDEVSLTFYRTMIYIGLFFYVIGILYLKYLFWKRILTEKSFFKIYTLPAESSYVYGGLCITGIAMMYSQTFPDKVIEILYVLIVILFVVIELNSLYDLCIRISKKGLRQVFFIYDPIFWGHLFNIATFYAFIVTYHDYDYSFGSLVLFIVNYGKYIVTVLMIWQLCLAILYASKHGFHYVTHSKKDL